MLVDASFINETSPRFIVVVIAGGFIFLISKVVVVSLGPNHEEDPEQGREPERHEWNIGVM